jgi:hypothetical protein
VSRGFGMILMSLSLLVVAGCSQPQGSTPKPTDEAATQGKQRLRRSRGGTHVARNVGHCGQGGRVGRVLQLTPREGHAADVHRTTRPPWLASDTHP